MKLARPHVIERTLKMQARFKTLTSPPMDKKSPAAIKMIAKEFFLAPRTVEDIVYGIGVYGDKPKVNKEFENQLNLFEHEK